jgi:hypothetical protein
MHRRRPSQNTGKGWVSRLLLKPHCVKPMEKKEMTVNIKCGTKKPRIRKADRTNFLGKEEIKFCSEVNYTFCWKKSSKTCKMAGETRTGCIVLYGPMRKLGFYIYTVVHSR